jgi:hypothetical protein
MPPTVHFQAVTMFVRRRDGADTSQTDTLQPRSALRRALRIRRLARVKKRAEGRPPARRRPVRRHWLRYLIPASALIVVLAGGGFAALESDTVESFWQGVWWALSLMTTVGFTGPEPATTGGRLLSAALMLTGFGLLTMTTAAVASLFVREDEEPEETALRAFEHRTLTELSRLHDRLERIESRLATPSAGAEPETREPGA